MNNDSNTAAKKQVNPIPEGFHTVTPFLIANNASMMMEFIKEAFDAEITYVFKDNEGKIMHATLKIGDSNIMVTDSSERMGPAPAKLFLYVDDVDHVYEKAISARAMSIREPMDEFYGDRAACVADAWDNHWWIATHVEDVSEEEIKKRAEDFQKKQA